jgi:hypothetical protein
MNNQNNTERESCCNSFLSPKDKNGSYSAVRYYGMILFVCSFVLTILIAIFCMSSSGTNLSAFSTNTFLNTHIRGSNEYTWFSWEKTSILTNFFSCTKNAKIFDEDVCVGTNETAYVSCLQQKYPHIINCIQYSVLLDPSASKIPGLSLSQSMINCLYANPNSAGNSQSVTGYAEPDIEVNDFQVYVLQRCITPDQKPILNVLQDKNSKFYLGSYNSGVVLFTAVWIIMVFLAYTAYVPNKMFGTDDDTVQSVNTYKLQDNDVQRWYRTGFIMTCVCTVVSALLFIALPLLTWRKSDIAETIVSLNIPMTVQTSTICMVFALMLFYYFGMEVWEKVLITDTMPLENKYAGEVVKGELGYHVNSQMRNRGRKQTMGITMAPKMYTNGDWQTPLLVFPWAECNVFSDALVFIGLFGLQTDVTTYEITQLFQVVMYAAVVCVIFAYDYYSDNNAGTKDGTWAMSFCSNCAALSFNIIPFVLIVYRFYHTIPDTIQSYLVAYAVIHFFMYIFKIFWQFYWTGPVRLGWDELFWCAKISKQLLFIGLIFFMAVTNFKMNDVLSNHVHVWLANY